MEVSTVNGSIRAAGLRGGDFSTVNGSVQLAVGHLDPGARLAVSSVNGSVSVVLPEDVGASLRVSTVNGRVSCAFPVDSGDGARHGLRGVIGGGGASVDISSVNGAVSILRPSAVAARIRVLSGGARPCREVSLNLASGDARADVPAGAMDAMGDPPPARSIPIDPL